MLQPNLINPSPKIFPIHYGRKTSSSIPCVPDISDQIDGLEVYGNVQSQSPPPLQTQIICINKTVCLNFSSADLIRDIKGKASPPYEETFFLFNFIFFSLFDKFVATDPEHPYTLEQLNVVQEDNIEVHYTGRVATITIKFTPTVPHCRYAYPAAAFAPQSPLSYGGQSFLC